MSDALPLQEQKSKIEFAKRLLDALGECADEEKYNIIHEMLKDVFSDPKDIETEYLSIYLPFFRNDEELEVWEAQRQELIKKAAQAGVVEAQYDYGICLLYTSPSPRDRQKSRMPSSA